MEGGTKSVETGELQPAHASVNRIIAITQPKLPLQKLLPPEKTGMDVDTMLQGWARGRDLWQKCQGGEQGSLPGEGALGHRASKDEQEFAQ